MDIKAIKARAEAATPGPWKVIDKGNTVKSFAVVSVAYEGKPQEMICPNMSPKTGNADFIAHARTDIPALITEVERLQAELDAAKKENEKRKEAIGKLASTLSQSGFCTHYAGYTCDKDWPEACEGCIKQWAMRGPVKGE